MTRTTQFNLLYSSKRPEPRTGEMRNITDFAHIGTKIRLHRRIFGRDITLEAEIQALPYLDKDGKNWLPIIIISWVGDIPFKTRDDISLADHGVVPNQHNQWSQFNWIELVPPDSSSND